MIFPATKTWSLRALGIAAFLALLLSVQIVLAQNFSDYINLMVMQAGVAVILAVSLNLINGIAGQFSLGHVGFAAIGAYASASFSVFVGPRLALVDPLIFAIGLVIGALAAAIAGWLVGTPSLRLRGDYLAIVTLGFGEIIRVVLRNIDAVGGATGLDNIPRWTSFAWVAGLAAACIACVWSLSDSVIGRSMRAVREDEIAAEAAGINTTRVKVTAFVVGAAWAGVAGGLQAHFSSLIRPTDFTFLDSVKIVVMVVLGGLGSISGAAIAGAGLRVLEEKLRNSDWAIGAGVLLALLTAVLAWNASDKKAPVAARLRVFVAPVAMLGAVLGLHFFGRVWVEANAPSLRYLIYALILIVLMLLRPQGLFGRSELGAHLWRRRAKPDSESTPQ